MPKTEKNTPKYSNGLRITEVERGIRHGEKGTPVGVKCHFAFYISEEKGRYISKQSQKDPSHLSGPKHLMS
jgi:hypothetical protein